MPALDFSLEENERHGFVQSEVDRIFEDANIKGKEEVIKKWYDGYHFGDVDVYCPWDVMCYIDDLQKNPNAKVVYSRLSKNKSSIHQI